MSKLSFYFLLIAFGIGCCIRLVPIIINYPFPVGYDSINYYLPNLYHFENNWITLITSFPVFITIVYLFSYFFNVDLYYTFLTSNVILYGLFSVTIYLLSNKVLNQPQNRSLIFAVFVIFQLGTLRISWDLFRNLFSLVLFNLFLILVYNFNKKNTLGHFISILTIFLISVITVFSDRMIGILLIIVSFIFSFICKQKYLLMVNIFFTLSFLYYFLSFDKITFVSSNINFLDILLNPIYGKNTFSQFDISVLFLSMYGVLIPFFIPGFILTKFRDNILIIKIPLLITLFFSFTWIFIPNYSYIVPDRWLLILGIYLSLISIHGFFFIIDSYLSLNHKRLKRGLVFVFLFIFVVYGFLFTIMPPGVIFSLPSFFQEHTGFILPFSMNFNSIKIKDNPDLLKSIDWINYNTPSNSTIIGSKDWRGWFSLFLHQSHQYLYAEEFVNINDTLLNKNQIKDFTKSLEKKFSYFCDHNKNYKNNAFLYFIDLHNQYNTSLFSNIVYHTKNFLVYNLSQQICKT
jgi:hypothetical protein